MSELIMSEGRRQQLSEHQSAEGMIAVALFSVCLLAALASWGFATFGGTTVTYRNLDALYSQQLSEDDLISAENAVLAEWSVRLGQQLSQREQLARQQQQNATLAQQAAALTEAREAALAAQRAAQEAEARARSAEQERALTLAKAQRERKQAEAEEKTAAEAVATTPVSAAPASRLGANVLPARVDWTSCEKPVYPLAAVRLRQQGTVVMAFAVDANGNAAEGRVVESSGTQRLDRAALSALSECTFEPETVDGTPRASTAQVRFAWRL